MTITESNKQEIRCPKCNRLLAKKSKEGYIEVKSKTSIFVVIEYKSYRINCKCGYTQKNV
jgi:phage FluMu protein Com